MSYHLFQFPLPGTDDLTGLNAFLASHQVVAVQQHLANTQGGGLIVFVVQTTSLAGKPETPRRRVDYQWEMTPKQFAVFSCLREERKRIAEVEGVSVYTIITNGHFAEMVGSPIRSLFDFAGIPGMGLVRLVKHRERLLVLFAEQKRASEEPLS